MKKRILGTMAALILLASCRSVPITGREQLNLVPSHTIMSMSYSQYQDFIAKNKVIQNTDDARRVKTVGSNIANAVERYFAEHNLSDQLKDYKWEFNLIDSKEVNAWCLPGGKVVVYSGLMPVAKDDNGLAVVLGHEISHAVAQHGDERMSQGLLTEMGGMALSLALSKNPEQTTNLFMQAYGLGTQVGVLLPFSRVQETEADHLGLIFMAMAGYDPQGAVNFWERMQSQQKGGAPPELLSTHPADAKRIENINKFIPEALTYYKK